MFVYLLGERFARRYENIGIDILHHREYWRDPRSSLQGRSALAQHRARATCPTTLRNPERPDTADSWRSARSAVPKDSPAGFLLRLSFYRELYLCSLTCSLGWIERIFLPHSIPRRCDLLPDSLDRSIWRAASNTDRRSRHARTTTFVTLRSTNTNSLAAKCN